MKVIYKKFMLDEEIPVRAVLKNKKLVKYFNRETSAGIVCLAELLDGMELPEDTPIYYDTGLIEYESFGLKSIVEAAKENNVFSQKAFIENGMSSISPLTQFKILLNMPLCFFTIENNLNGDNAVVYSSANGLIEHMMLSNYPDGIIIGAGKVNSDGSVESGFALLEPLELKVNPTVLQNKEGIEIFRQLHKGVYND